MASSYWHRPDQPDTLTVDLAIVGAGVAGISAALEAEARGMNAVIIERHTPAWGASGRNAGYLMRGMAESYALAADTLGRERAQAIWRWSEDNLKALRALGASSLPRFADRPSCLTALDDNEADLLRRSEAMLREDGFAVETLAPPQTLDPLWQSGRPIFALLNPSDATCHPVELVRFLRDRLTRTPILAETDAHTLSPSTDGLSIETTGPAIHAKHALLCTNAWTAHLLPRLRDTIMPKRGQMLAATPAEPTPLAFAYYLNHGNEYIRTAPNGDLLIGGCRRFEPESESGDHPGTHPRVQAELERTLAELVTPNFKVTARWSGTMAFAPNDLPLVGSVPEPGFGANTLHLCAGFTGHGMSLAHLAARHAVSIIAGEPPRHPFNDPADFL
jgi:gamma-glutamylputrescine oxidase